MLLAQPWWVNLLIFVPVVSFCSWRRQRPAVNWTTLVAAAAFAAAFGFVEAATVDYLRGNVPTLQSASVQSIDIANPHALHILPDAVLKTETFREAATIIMLIAVPYLGAARARERWALFLWCFAIWDIMYYIGLWMIIDWPRSLRDIDVLFLIPKPWFAEVWFPILVSGATILAVIAGRSRPIGRRVLSKEALTNSFVPPAIQDSVINRIQN